MKQSYYIVIVVIKYYVFSTTTKTVRITFTWNYNYQKTPIITTKKHQLRPAGGQTMGGR
jgi:hypothetical protein